MAYAPHDQASVCPRQVSPGSTFQVPLPTCMGRRILKR